MSATLDIILVLICIAGFIVGAVRGFVRSVAKPIRIAASLVLAYFLCSTLGPMLIQPVIQESISNQVSTFLIEKCPELDLEHIPTILKFAASLCNIDLSTCIGETHEESAALISAYVAEPLARIVAIALAFILLFLICSLLLRMLLSLIDYALKKSPLKGFNRALGSVFGGLAAFVFVWIFCALFTWFISLPAVEGAEWARNFEPGPVYGLFRSIDPIELLLSF